MEIIRNFISVSDDTVSINIDCSFIFCRQWSLVMGSNSSLKLKMTHANTIQMQNLYIKLRDIYSKLMSLCTSINNMQNTSIL